MIVRRKLKLPRSRDASLTVGVHPGAEGVENPRHSHGDVVLPVKVEEQGLRHALALVVTSSHACVTQKCGQRRRGKNPNRRQTSKTHHRRTVSLCAVTSDQGVKIRSSGFRVVPIIDRSGILGCCFTCFALAVPLRQSSAYPGNVSLLGPSAPNPLPIHRATSVP